MSEPLIRVQIDSQRKVVTVTRTSAPVAAASVVSRMIDDTRAALAPIARGEFGVVIDLRAAPLAIESRFAAAFITLRKELCAGFRKAIFVVETKVGLLQVQRFVREERLDAIVVDRLEDVAPAMR